MQAIYDLYYDVPLKKMDHLQWQGVVPRTFLGAQLVTAMARLVLKETDGITLLILVRVILALMTGATFLFLDSSLHSLKTTAYKTV